MKAAQHGPEGCLGSLVDCDICQDRAYPQGSWPDRKDLVLCEACGGVGGMADATCLTCAGVGSVLEPRLRRAGERKARKLRLARERRARERDLKVAA